MKAPKINTKNWVEIRCASCDNSKFEPRLLLKIISENLVKIKKPSIKIGIETKCKDCYKFTYRTFII